MAVFCGSILISANAPVLAGKGEKKQAELWRQTDKARLASRGRLPAISGNTRVFSLNRALLNDIFSQAPLEFTDAARQTQVILEIPTPEGGTARFRIEESPMLAPHIAAQHPTWKQFSGQGIDDPTATARFDVNINGFHGYVIGAGGTFLIDPYSLADQSNYVVYYKGTVGNSERGNFSCQVPGRHNEETEFFAPFTPNAFNNGTTLRNYRLALSATKEYTAFFRQAGDTDAQAQTRAFAAMTTTVNRINLVYRRDLATIFTLVSDTRTVFTTANDGGFPDASNSDVANLSLARNAIVLNNTYTLNGYDIGHALSRTGNPNGLALSPSLCSNDDFPNGTPNSPAKAQGFTGAPTPQGDGFDVDYVAHEFGHQFGMSHTFNNDADGSCTTRATDSAYEPASGITIMGYGGICAPRNLAANSIEYFNLRSFDQSLTYLTSTDQNTPGCGTKTATNNTLPIVNTVAAYNIPRLTPFTLTATATDGDGDALTYLWEEFDLGAATRNGGATDTDADGNTARPIFRAYNATTSPSRTFPSLNYILDTTNNIPAGSNQPQLTYTGTLPNAPTTGSTNGYVCAANETCVRGEQLPTIGRTMNFRVTVRDNRAGGGGVADALSAVTIAPNTGPFQVTAQNTRSALAPGATWQAGTTQTVTWDVAGTDAAPISVANVRILLSTDGGQTFPITLLASTPNNGTATITVPNNLTTTARIKVEAVGNIFFDINNVNFAITAAPTAAGVTVSGRVLSSLGRGIASARVKLTDQNGVVRLAITSPFGYYRFENVAAGQTYIFNVTHKRYQFAPRVNAVTEDLSNFNFVAND